MKSKVEESDRKVKGVSFRVIRAMFLKDRLTLTQIATHVGCSFQRIGQVLREMGVDAVTIGRARRKETAQLRRAQNSIKKEFEREKSRRLKEKNRKSANLEKYRAWLVLWREGLRVSEIAVRHGISTPHASVVINRLRRRYGWFPLRNWIKGEKKTNTNA